MPSTAALIEKARVSSPAIAAGAVRWKNDSTKLASTMPNTSRRVARNAPSCGAGAAVGMGHCNAAYAGSARRFAKMAVVRRTGMKDMDLGLQGAWWR